MKKRIYISPPHMSGDEQKYLEEVFENNFIAPVGEHIDRFEDDLEQYLQEGKHVAALSSGTAAIHLALILSGVERGDKVLCQSFTFCASTNPVLYQGAEPIFIDSEEKTWNLDPKLLEQAIEQEERKGKKPKALVLVHLYGMPAQMNEISEICKHHRIKIIEDAAEALGSQYKGRKCGAFGDYSVLSFNGNKILTTGGGGALVCNTLEEKQKAIFLSTQAREKEPHYEHKTLGYNYRMSNVSAAIGRGQMHVLDKRIAQKRSIRKEYENLFKNSDFEFLDEEHAFFSNCWLSAMLTSSFNQREDIRLKLEKENIESRPFWKPMHLQPLYNSFTKYLNGVSAKLYERGICLPSSTNMDELEWNRIKEALKNEMYL